MKRDNRFTAPAKTMPVDYVNSLYAIVDIQRNPAVEDATATRLKSKAHRLTVLENDLVVEERKLARAFSQREYNEIESRIDTLNDKIEQIKQELTEVRPEWMINLLRKVAK